MRAVIERLSGEPADRLQALVSESERQGFRFVRRLVEEWSSGANRFDRPGEVLFAARSGDDVVGVCGLNVDPHASDPRVGRVRHLYVLVPYRRAGVGEHLVADIIGTARGRFTRLHLRTTSAAAARLYERLGFRPTSGAPDHSHVLELQD
ncbi:MAG TPA: GNAT family N-acetyltransferase [Methylomirabilota bacterium]|nr:GNAT family N-acetyltransferase [Methylomirabilota bacterium]